MALYLRAPSVSYNALYGMSGNADLYTAEAFFDFVIPSDWDNTTSPPLFTITVVGGVVADGPAPTSFSIGPQFDVYSVNGGSGLTAALSGSGKSYAIGSVTHSWYGYSGIGSHWTTIGLGSTKTASVAPTALSTKSATLIDGNPYGQPGEAFTAGGIPAGPVGWQPDVAFGSIGDGTGQVKIAANQTVTIGIRMFSDCTDSVNPDRSVFGVIQSITLSYNGTDYPIDITTLKVGWSAGASYTSYFNGVTDTVYPNPRATVSLTPPSITHPNAQAYVDFYLYDAAPPSQPYRIQVGLIPGRVGSGGAGLG